MVLPAGNPPQNAARWQLTVVRSFTGAVIVDATGITQDRLLMISQRLRAMHETPGYQAMWGYP